MFYNKLIADKKPYFFRYKYSQLAREYNEYKKKNEENAEIHFSKGLNELMDIRDNNPNLLTEEEKTFLMYYDKFLPVIDSDCVMNKVCKHIESIDFHIKQRVRSNHNFDYRVLTSSNFNVNKSLYSQIKAEVENTFKDWDQRVKAKRATKVEKTLSQSSNIIKFDKEVEMTLLKSRLEEICSNEESLANHLVYLFYEDRPSFSKATLWNLVGRQIFETVKNRKASPETGMYYIDFPVKDENGDMEFLYEKYQIKHMGLNANPPSAKEKEKTEEEKSDD